MDAGYADKLDGKIPEDFRERKMSEWRTEEQQVRLAIDGFTGAETSDSSLESRESVRTFLWMLRAQHLQTDTHST